MEYEIMCIFMESGKTFTFRDVEILQDSENILEFSYNAMSDGKGKSAIFLKSRLVGYSMTDYDEN